MLTDRRAFVAAAVIVAAITVARVASTYTVFSQTSDEPVHIAAGFEWLSTDGYHLDLEHPPLPRIAFAFPAFLQGASVSPDLERLRQGNQILHANDRYRQNLALSRIGNLPFLLLAIAAVTTWTRRLFGNGAALIAAAIFGSLPPILGHAALATTDLAAAATTVAAAFSFARWLEEPSRRNTIVLGLFTALGALSKFSFPVFFGVIAVVMVIARVTFRKGLVVRMLGREGAIVVLIAVAGLWAGYKLEVGTLNENGY